MRLRSATTAIALSAAALLVPALLPAQFTTYIAPARKSADTAKPKTPATVAKARADSASRMSLTDMKAWVDSAAGTSKPVVSTGDTAILLADTATLAPRSSAPVRSTTTFSNGSIAPNTATSLPTLLTLGVALIAVGALLFRWRPRRA